MNYRTRGLLPRSVFAAIWVALSLTLTLSAQEPPSQENQLERGDTLMSRLQYEDAYVVYRALRDSSEAQTRVRAGTGMVRALLRLNLYAEAAKEGAAVANRDGALPSALAL